MCSCRPRCSGCTIRTARSLCGAEKRSPPATTSPGSRSQRAAAHEAGPGREGFAFSPTAWASPSLWDQLERMQQRFPRMSWCEYEPAAPVRPLSPSGKSVEPIYDLGRADVVRLPGRRFPAGRRREPDLHQGLQRTAARSGWEFQPAPCGRIGSDPHRSEGGHGAGAGSPSEIVELAQELRRRRGTRRDRFPDQKSPKWPQNSMPGA